MWRRVEASACVCVVCARVACCMGSPPPPLTRLGVVVHDAGMARGANHARAEALCHHACYARWIATLETGSSVLQLALDLHLGRGKEHDRLRDAARPLAAGTAVAETEHCWLAASLDLCTRDAAWLAKWTRPEMRANRVRRSFGSREGESRAPGAMRAVCLDFSAVARSRQDLLGRGFFCFHLLLHILFGHALQR
eukprot:5822274-Prymnesium_polylepis.2